MEVHKAEHRLLQVSCQKYNTVNNDENGKFAPQQSVFLSVYLVLFQPFFRITTFLQNIAEAMLVFTAVKNNGKNIVQQCKRRCPHIDAICIVFSF